MVLLKRIAINRTMLNRVWHHSITWRTSKRGYMTAVSWAIDKGDWWKTKDEEKPKFFSVCWKHQSNEFARTGIYIGRLAAVIQTKVR